MKKLIIPLIVVIVAIAAYFGYPYLISDSDTAKQTHARWISAHTSGTISSDAVVKVYFTNAVVKPDQVGAIAPKGLLNISPSKDGQAIWSQTNVLEFTPASPFKNGEKYEVSVDLEKAVDSISGVDEYEFTFQIIEQDFAVEIDGIEPVDIKNYDLQKVYGKLTLADKTDEEKIKKMVQATIGSQSFNIKWTAGKNGKKYEFVVDSIERIKTQQKLVLSYSGDPVGVSKKGSVTYDIPAKGDFRLTSYMVNQHPDQQVKIIFSDPLNRFQNLEGLVYFDKIKNYEIDVDGNILIIQLTTRQDQTDQLHLSKGIKSLSGKQSPKDTIFEIVFEELKPAVRTKTDDIILPPSGNNALFAFEAVNLRAVDVRVYQIFQNNIIQFLQVNSLGGDYQLNRVGKPIFEQTVVLDQYAGTDLGQWNTFYLDLTKIVDRDPGALYHVQISFRQENAITHCDDNQTESKAVIADKDFWDGFERWSYTDYYSWRDRDDPCKGGYYGYRRAMKHNFMISDIGIIAKQGQDKNIHIFTTSLSNAEIMTGVKVDVLDYQQQVLKNGITDENGHIAFQGLKDAYFVKAHKDNHTSFLRVVDNNSLSFSHFPTNGETVQDGIKGFIYNERGVWRPGDTIHAGFMLYDLTNQLPDNIPITFELFNARYQSAGKEVLQRNEHDHYMCKFTTTSDAPTGKWSLKVNAGGTTFSKSISVETVKPNRLKLNIETPDIVIADNEEPIKMHVEWLHGAPVKNLKTTVEGTARKSFLKFDQWPGYEFNHQESKLNTDPSQYFKGNLNELGDIEIPPFKPNVEKLPSKVSLSYFFKVFEPNGNFSISSASQEYLPYESYIGMRIPEPNGRYNMFQTDKPISIEVAACDAKGDKALSKLRAKARLYKVSWSWWWESGEDFDYYYRRYKKLIKTEYININNGKGSFNIEVGYNDWGRYLIEVENLSNGQIASDFIYFDWPSIAGRSNRPDGVSQSMLRFATDKTDYKTGETVNFSFPSAPNGKALISIEDGVTVIEHYWIDTQKDETSFSFKTTPEMSPNCYINIHYIQDYSNTTNDLPLRLYGLAGINVTDPDTELKPVIEMDETIESGAEFEIRISEQEGKEMNYSIAIVDEGLLALTNFSTPNPHGHFFRHEALGVMTWDLFDWVIGAFNGTIERVIGIGGGAEAPKKPNQVADERFKPVVVVKGPFNLKKGKEAVHKIKLPPYIGEVRTMVIARSETAFGRAHRYTKVKSPLMIMSTAPRKLVLKDEFILPVTVFRDQERSGTVTVKIETGKNFEVENPERKLSFESGQQEKLIYFNCKAGNKPGSSSFSISANDGRNNTEENLNIEVYNPNPIIYNVEYFKIPSNETQTVSTNPVGVAGTNQLTAEVATIAPFNIRKHMSYLLNYPHGCIEQTVSGVLGLVYIPKIISIDEKTEKRISKKISAALERLKKFQTTSGGLAYWPGNRNVNEWGTSYGGHFMAVAKDAGYHIDDNLYNRWLSYQKRKAKNWVDDGPSSQLQQAYRLYTLALAGKSQRGAMNRLRNTDKLPVLAKWRLAAAYAIDGKEKVAKKLVEAISLTQETKVYYSTYGSRLRDQAMILQTLDNLGRETEAMNLIADMSDQMTGDRWHSTQTRAWVLYAIGEFYQKRDVAKFINLAYSINNGKEKKAESRKHIMNIDLPFEYSLSQNISFTNKSDGDLFLQLINQGQPFPKIIDADSESLNISVTYMDFDRKTIGISKLEQTEDFIVRIEVKHPGTRGTYRDMALTFTAPSGWEIINTRFTEFEGSMSESTFTFRDYRDTQVMTYFDIYPGKTKTFYLKLNATYPGKYYFAPVKCEAMYDHTIRARTNSQYVEITKK
jgi:uncharacterized protein YfaS (alpha-2-macroglobulin family)